MTSRHTDDGLRILAFDHKRILGWPGHEERRLGCAAYLMTPHRIFTSTWQTDAHYSAYGYDVGQNAPRRLTIAAPQAIGSIRMKLLVIDVDAPDHANVGASSEWRSEFAKRVGLLSGDPYSYETRGGSRIVFSVDQFLINGIDSVYEWKKNYLKSLIQIYITSGLIGDPRCIDWTRLYRAPHVMRDGIMQTGRTVTGDPGHIGRWLTTVPNTDLGTALENLALTSNAWSGVWRNWFADVSGTKPHQDREQTTRRRAHGSKHEAESVTSTHEASVKSIAIGNGRSGLAKVRVEILLAAPSIGSPGCVEWTGGLSPAAASDTANSLAVMGIGSDLKIASQIRFLVDLQTSAGRVYVANIRRKELP